MNREASLMFRTIGIINETGIFSLQANLQNDNAEKDEQVSVRKEIEELKKFKKEMTTFFERQGTMMGKTGYHRNHTSNRDTMRIKERDSLIDKELKNEL